MEINFRPEDEAYLKSRLEADPELTVEALGSLLAQLLRQDEQNHLLLDELHSGIDLGDDDEEELDGPACIRELEKKYFQADSAIST